MSVKVIVHTFAVGRKNIALLCFVIVVSSISLFVDKGHWTTDYRTFAWAQPKIEPHLINIGEYVLENTPEGGLVLAPWELNHVIIQFPGAPGMIAVKKQYLQSAFSKVGDRDEAKERARLVDFVSGSSEVSEKEAKWAIQQISFRGIATVVYRDDLNTYVPKFEVDLRRMGFHCKKDKVYYICHL
jgi:hypothetical protein